MINYELLEKDESKGYILGKTGYSLNAFVVIMSDKLGTDSYQFFHTEAEARQFIDEKF